MRQQEEGPPRHNNMAFERQSDIIIKDAESFDAFVTGTVRMYQTQFAMRNADDELNFSRLVLEENLSLEDQLSYRQQQRKRVKGDPIERKRIKGEISKLKDRIEQKEFADSYLEQVINVESGVSSIDRLLVWLRNRRDATKDLAIESEINRQIAIQEGNKFTLQQEALTNQTNFALKDKSESLINDQIENLTSIKNEALLAGNASLVTTYDLQLQALGKAKEENRINNEIKNFAVSTITGNSSATSLLDAYNERALNATPSGNITVGGITYNSPREFWGFKRDSYIADNSENGFFARVKAENVAVISDKHSANILTNTDISNSSQMFDDLATRAELQNFLPKVQSTKQEVIQTGVNFRAGSVVNKYAKDLDITAAFSSLKELRNLGGNVDSAQTAILTSAAETKQAQISGILKITQDLLAADPNLTAQEAVEQAIAAGAGIVLSPEELVRETEREIAERIAETAEAGEFGEDPRTTVQEPEGAAPPAEPPAPAPTPTPTPPVAITGQFQRGARDPQILELQKFLNAQGFQVSASGPGSPGQEVQEFGPLTEAALRKFQAARGIVSTGTVATTGFGRLGPKTLAAIKSIMNP